MGCQSSFVKVAHFFLLPLLTSTLSLFPTTEMENERKRERERGERKEGERKWREVEEGKERE